MSEASPTTAIKSVLKRPYEWNLKRRAPGAFRSAYEEYWTSGVVPAGANELLNHAIWASDGVLPRELAQASAPKFDPSSVADFRNELFAAVDVEAAVADLRAEGFHVVPSVLPGEIVDGIRDLLDEGPARPQGDSIGDVEFGAPSDAAPTWWMQGAPALRSAAVRGTLTERAPVSVAGTYLGSDPMIMSLVLWKSYAREVADSSSAQLFHYDYDRASFLKMFVYLSDVGPENGPHTYVPRSHGRKPSALVDGRRLTDAEVGAVYPRDTWKTICGPRGTVFFADTQGFHKGERVAEGTRSILQICFASDRFGYAANPPVGPSSDSPEDLRASVIAHPRYFSELFTPDRLVP